MKRQESSINMSEKISVVLNFNPEIFDPKKETLLAIAAEVSKITADPAKMTKDDLELINSTKNKLVKARTTIEKTGKALRDPHTAYNRSVSTYENELIAIIEPQELRLKELEVSAKEYATKQERLKVLPEYKEQLAEIGDDVAITDDELLGMDPTAFQAYYNTRLGAHLNMQKAAAEAEAEAKRIADETKEREAKADAERAEKEKEEARQTLISGRVEELYKLGILQPGARPIILTLDGEIEVTREILADYSTEMFEEAKKLWSRLTKEKSDHDAVEAKKAEDARVAAAEVKAKEEAEAEAKRIADEKEAKRLADEQAEKDRLALEKEKEAKEKAEREAAESYQKWLSDNSYNPETDKVEELNGTGGHQFILYREVSRLK